VIVDARPLGGGVSTGCVTGDPDTGLRALTMAGYSYAFVPRQPGLVCQVDGAPECSRTSRDAYWSYWYRPKGSSTWVYSSRGAHARDPEPGSTEAWVWQDGDRRPPPDIALRTICPQLAQPRATTTASPSPARTRTASRSPSPRQSAAESLSSASGRTTEKRSPTTTTPSSAAPPTTTTGSPSATGSVVAGGATAAPSTPSSPAMAAAASRQDPGGVPWAGVAVGAALIAALGGAALARGRQARRGGGP